MASLAALDWYEKNKFYLYSKKQMVSNLEVSNKPESIDDLKGSNADNVLPFKENPLNEVNTIISAPNSLPTLIFPFFLSATLTSILVISATEYFGTTLFGYAKAIALECGILGLVAYRTETIKNLLSNKICLISAILLSVFVLHSGSTLNSPEREILLSDISNSISDLEQTKVVQIANIQNTPDSHVTRKQFSIQALAETNDKLASLKEKRSEILLSKSLSSLSLSEITDSLMRVVFMMLNMYFTHSFVSRVRQLLCPVASREPLTA
jgi:hypothetical protein